MTALSIEHSELQHMIDELREAKLRLSQLEFRIEQISKVTAVATSPGNWDYDPYLHGMANGLLLAYSIIEGLSYKPLDPPAEWLSDRKRPTPPNKITGDTP